MGKNPEAMFSPKIRATSDKYLFTYPSHSTKLLDNA